MKRIGILIVVALALVLAAVEAGAQTSAVLSTVTGKVEIQNPGETTWQAATVGMEVPLRATISTGFNGRAVLQMGATTVSVGPVTRLRIDELSKQNNVVKTNLAMPVGRIRALVKSTGGAKNDFTVKGALSTAAVRGTGFDTDGVHTDVFDSIVSLLSQSGISIDVHSGESGVVTGGGSPSGGAGQLNADTGVNSSTSTTGGGGLGGGLPGTGYGTVTINWQ
jgi:FecR protein